MTSDQRRQLAEQIVRGGHCDHLYPCDCLRDVIASALADAARHGARAALERVETPLRDAWVILEGLRLSVEWELAPSIKQEIARVAVELEALLRTRAAQETGDETT